MLPINVLSAVRNEDLRYPKFRSIVQARWFKGVHFFLVVLSFIIPGVMSFYDDQIHIMKLMTNTVIIPLVLLHSIINFCLVIDNMNPPHNKGCRYLAAWSVYEVLKFLFITIHIGSTDLQNIEFKLTYVVQAFLIFEGIHFFITEFETPRKLVEIITRDAKKLAWSFFTLFITIYFFAFIGYCLFKDGIRHAHANGNDFIEGKEFDDIINSIITLFDINDWFNSYLIREIELSRPGALFYWVFPYIIMSRFVICNLILALIIDIFRDPITEKLQIYAHHQPESKRIQK